MESFLLCFYILDQCYDFNPKDDLGGFLGAISPELWEDGVPIDKAIYNDWKSVYPQNQNNSFIDKVIIFLEYEEKNYFFDFNETKKILRENDKEEFINIAKEKVKELCCKFKYED